VRGQRLGRPYRDSHPIGLTGIGQIAEVTLQLRGESGARQQPNAHTGLAHMVGLRSVSLQDRGGWHRKRGDSQWLGRCVAIIFSSEPTSAYGQEWPFAR